MVTTWVAVVFIAWLYVCKIVNELKGFICRRYYYQGAFRVQLECVGLNTPLSFPSVVLPDRGIVRNQSIAFLLRQLLEKFMAIVDYGASPGTDARRARAISCNVKRVVESESILPSRWLPAFPLLWLSKMTWASGLPRRDYRNITRRTGIVETVSGSCDKHLNWSRIVWVYRPQGTKVTVHEPVTDRSKTRD